MDDRIKEKKEKGNKLFSEKKYKEAIEEYNEALSYLLKDNNKDENQTAVILSNRSASRFLLGMLLV